MLFKTIGEGRNVIIPVDPSNVLMGNQLPPEISQTPKKGRFGERYKLALFIGCCILCLLLESFILLYSALSSKHSEEASSRARVALDNIFLRILALPLGDRGARSPFNSTANL